ncbi:DUF3945 domain-containing protein [uncultured Alistipes sp.]|uniref:DUF3945 domain-containing protein n=1 Tax=uncultured Alistipes sp. TaxID=538949 RepID=UPI00261DEAB3|nr:DUF3945 domain-containing protein [uncultured Alistipes sp.]
MEQKKKEQDVLVVRDEQTGEIGVVAGLKRDGTPNMKPAKAEHAQDFLRFDRHGDVLDNFFANFYRQCTNPKRFAFYRVTAEGIENVLTVMREMLKKPDEYREVLAAHRVDTAKYEQQAKQMRQEAQQDTDQGIVSETPDGVSGRQEDETESQSAEAEQQIPDEWGYKPIDDSRLDRTEIAERWGIDLAVLEASGDLERMRNYGKSRLIDCNPEIGGIRVPMQARLSLRENSDGTVSLVPHPIRRAPNYDEYLNVKFTPEDQENLKKTGNLGRIVEVVDPTTGELLPSFVSIDRITNETVSVPVRDIKTPHEVLGVAMDDDQRAALFRGEGVYVEGMTSKKNGRCLMLQSKLTPTSEDWIFISAAANKSNVRNRRKWRAAKNRKNHASCVSETPCSKNRLPTKSRKAGNKTTGSILKDLLTKRDNLSMPMYGQITNEASTISPANDRMNRKSMKSNPTTPLVLR